MATGGRNIIESVVVFLHNGDKYLLLERSAVNDVDPGVCNGVGGRVRTGETYLDTAVRKVEEETGYKLGGGDLIFRGLAREEECEYGDWTMAYYTAEVKDEMPPLGWEPASGKLEWVEKDKVTEMNVVPDLKYIFPEIVSGKQGHFFAAWKYDRKGGNGVRITRSG